MDAESYASLKRKCASCLRIAATRRQGSEASRRDYGKMTIAGYLQRANHRPRREAKCGTCTKYRRTDGSVLPATPRGKRERRGKIKWRIVFDASSNEGDSPSLNDVLEMGPNLLPEVMATLQRFREHPVAIIGNIQQAFLQLPLDRRDRDLTRFLWYRTPETTKVITIQQMKW